MQETKPLQLPIDTNDTNDTAFCCNAVCKQQGRMLFDFAANASHDIAEPLRTITLLAERIARQDKELNETSHDDLERIAKASERIQQMMDSLFELGQLTQNKSLFEITNLQETVASVLDDLECRIRDTQGRINVGTLPRIEANPIQMYQLFSNLINNALKFHKDDVRPIIYIQSNSRYDTVDITVTDNGIGFDVKHTKELFRLFKQLNGKNEYEGSGIGLAICKTIIACHNGKITADSTNNNGSTFHVSLPIKQN